MLFVLHICIASADTGDVTGPDADADGVEDSADCMPANPLVAACDCDGDGLTTDPADPDPDDTFWCPDPAGDTAACFTVAPDDQDCDDDGVRVAQDCDDADPTVFPGAPELCDGLDNDCDGDVDEGLSSQTYYLDGDGDSYGSPGTSTSACAQPPDHVPGGLWDCDDREPDVHPGADELCNGVDDDCNGTIVEG